MLWIFLVLVYGVIKGVREVLKKKALGKNSLLEVLFFYTLISFVLLIPTLPNAMGVVGFDYLFIALKALIIFIAWLSGFYAISKLPIGVYGILDAARVLFSTLFGICVLHEEIRLGTALGFILVVSGILLLKGRRSSASSAGGPSEERIPLKIVLCALLSCLLNALSGLMDKLLMSTGRLNDTQLQFWYMLFLVAFYLLYIIFTRTKINIKSSVSNIYIWLLAVFFVIADKCLFIANSYPESSVAVMTLLKQAGIIVTIILGRFIFKEKRTLHKLLCAALVLIGILLSVVL